MLLFLGKFLSGTETHYKVLQSGSMEADSSIICCVGLYFFSFITNIPGFSRHGYTITHCNAGLLGYYNEASVSVVYNSIHFARLHLAMAIDSNLI